MSSTPSTRRARTAGRAAHTLAASYERKSDRDPLGIEDQYAINRQKAAREDHDIPDDPAFRFSDDDTTGAAERRPDFDRLVAVVTTGRAPFTRLYVKDRYRFGRWADARLHNYYEVLFQKHGVLIRYESDEETAGDRAQRGVDGPPEDSGQRIGRHIKNAVVQVLTAEERATLIARTRTGMRSRVVRGFYPGSKAPYGMSRWLVEQDSGHQVKKLKQGERVHRDGHVYKLAWDEDGTPAVVAEVFEAYAGGESLSAIARRLTASGVRTPSARHAAGAAATEGAAPRKKPVATTTWAGSGVARLLANRIYCGDLLWAFYERTPGRGRGRQAREEPTSAAEAKLTGTEPILFLDFVPGAPVSRDLFARVAKRRADARDNKRGQRASRPEFLLSAFLTCAECGRPVYGHNAPPSRPELRRRYRHEQNGRARTAPPCGRRRSYVPAEDVESAVLGCIEVLLRDDGLAAAAREEAVRLLGDDQVERRASEHARLAERLDTMRESLAALEAERAGVANAELRAAQKKASEKLAEDTTKVAQQVQALGVEVAHLERARADAARQADRFADLRAAFAGASADERQQALRMLVERAALDFDRRTVDLVLRAIPAAPSA